MSDFTDLGRLSASETAARVRTGALSPCETVRASLERIRALDGPLGSFQKVRWERALEEAEALGRREDLPSLPLAGVPVGIKDNLPVAGEPCRNGSPATPATPAAADHACVRALRRAGAVVVGTTRVPELCVWPTTDGPLGTARNPWNLELTPGGSSGGSAAAVAAGLVPLAVGNDGLGSLRIPGAACGVIGIKPGAGLVPADLGANDWYGMSENGVLTTNVADAALGLSIVANRPELAEVSSPRPLRLALSVRSPAPGVRVRADRVAAAWRAAERLRAEGHEVEAADPPFPLVTVAAVMARWTAGAAADAEDLELRRLDRRTRRHVRLGRAVRRLGGVRARDRERWRSLQEGFFVHRDGLLTPALARPPLRADAWRRRGWLANVLAGVSFAPFAAPWNLAGWPAASVPCGLDERGLPVAVQIVAPPGGEATILALARQLEARAPWPRHAPRVAMSEEAVGDLPVRPSVPTARAPTSR